MGFFHNESKMKKSLILLVFFSCSKNENYNVVWIVVEDQSQYFFPTYGNDEISLPNLESLADESLVFENMYATYPVCAPARSSIITGMYPSSIGTHNMRAHNGNREVRGMKNDFNPCSESESVLRCLISAWNNSRARVLEFVKFPL